ncbi:hypothetical protein QTP86_027752, partial [Hemibagrus guttatus]
QEKLLSSTWSLMGNATKMDLENNLDCWGLFNNTADHLTFDTDLLLCKASCLQTQTCKTCGYKMLQHASEALRILGGVGLFFSFTEILGVWLAMRYRNQKDPRANPSAFL